MELAEGAAVRQCIQTQHECMVGCICMHMAIATPAAASCCRACHRDADAARVLRDVYRLGSSYSSAPSGMVDLSDTTISRLGSKLTIMRDLKVRGGSNTFEEDGHTSYSK